MTYCDSSRLRSLIDDLRPKYSEAIEQLNEVAEELPGETTINLSIDWDERALKELIDFDAGGVMDAG